MYSIGKLAEVSGIDPYTLRYYEKIGLLPKPSRKKNGYRDYGEQDLTRLEFIQQARAIGLTLLLIKHLLDLKEKKREPCALVRKIFSDKAMQLKQQMEMLRTMKEELRAFPLSTDAHEVPENACPCPESHLSVLKKSARS